MRDIPKGMQREELKFILLKPRDKIPIEYGWQNGAWYKFDDIKIFEHLSRGGNVGLACQKGINITIDFDSKEIQEKIVPKLPPTLTTITGSGLLHKHYWCKDGENVKILGKNKETLVDIQADRKQVVIPPSIHPNGNEYRIIDDKPIGEITMAEVKALFAEYLPNEGLKVTQYVDKPAQVLKNKISFESLLRDYGVDPSVNPCMCPLGHTSKGGKCFHYDDVKQVAYCFHCEWGGDIISLVEEKEKVGFPQALRLLADKFKVSIPVQSVSSKDDEAEFEHNEIADLLMEKFNFITIAETDVVYIYRDGTFNPLAESFIKRRVEEICQGLVKSHFVREVIESIKRRSFWSVEELELPLNLVVVNNGVLDLFKQQLLPHSPEYKAFTKLPVNYVPEKDCPLFKKFLSEVIKEDDLLLVQEMFGFCLYRDYFIHKAFMLTGSGSNGKSTLLNCLKAFLGHRNISNVALQSLEVEKFSRAELHNRLANVFTEVSARSLDTSGYFKALTGGDQITAERKGQHPFNFVSYAKQVYSANQIPMIRDDSDALFRRWVIVRFEKQFTNNANPHLTRELTTPGELAGVLNWALAGFLRLYQNGKFTHNKSIDEVRDQYNRLADPIRCFYEDCLHFDDTNNFVSKEELFDNFKKYVKFYQLPQVKDLGAFCKQLYNFFPPTVIDERTMINNIRKRGFRGVTLREVVHL